MSALLEAVPLFPIAQENKDWAHTQEVWYTAEIARYKSQAEAERNQRDVNQKNKVEQQKKNRPLEDDQARQRDQNLKTREKELARFKETVAKMEQAFQTVRASKNLHVCLWLCGDGCLIL